MALWLENGIYIISAVLNRMVDEWQFLGVSVLYWIVGVWVVTVVLRNFLYDV